ncbi:hypothetical protein Tco_0215611 [Tanacetum coccineum]
MIGAIGSMSFLTPLSVIQEESDILWKLTLLFPNLRVMVPVSNLIMALAVERNGVPNMKGLFSPFVGKSHVGGVGHDVHIGPLIDEGVHVLKVPYGASVVGCHLRFVTPFFFPFRQRDRIHVLGEQRGNNGELLLRRNLASSIINKFSGVLLVLSSLEGGNISVILPVFSSRMLKNGVLNLSILLVCANHCNPLHEPRKVVPNVCVEGLGPCGQSRIKMKRRHDHKNLDLESNDRCHDVDFLE